MTSLPWNPLDWRGPQFLLLMVGLAAGLVVAIRWFMRQQEGTEAPRIPFTDPYLIGYLRLGHGEAVRLALGSLADRGYLTLSSNGRVDRQGGDPDQVRRPLERAVLAATRDADTLTAILGHAETKAATDGYRQNLETLGLLPDSAVKTTRGLRVLLAIGIYWAVGLAKIGVALRHHHHNVGFLVLLLLVVPVILSSVGNPRLTTKGKALLKDLQTLFTSLKDRRSSLAAGGATTDMAMLAAVFGLHLLPREAFPWVAYLSPSRSSNGVGTNHSCGSSCGSSCSSGCGGGGCGGCGS